MIFEPPLQIDDVWATIKRETEAGELGFASKVSTMKDKGNLRIWKRKLLLMAELLIK